MSTSVDDVMDRIRRMNPRDRRALVRGIVREGFLSEDEEDALVSESRKHEPTISAEVFFEELGRKRGQGD